MATSAGVVVYSEQSIVNWCRMPIRGVMIQSLEHLMLKQSIGADVFLACTMTKQNQASVLNDAGFNEWTNSTSMASLWINEVGWIILLCFRLVIIDDNQRRAMWIYFMKEKAEGLVRFIKWHKRWQRRETY